MSLDIPMSNQKTSTMMNIKEFEEDFIKTFDKEFKDNFENTIIFDKETFLSTINQNVTKCLELKYSFNFKKISYLKELFDAQENKFKEDYIKIRKLIERKYNERIVSHNHSCYLTNYKRHCKFSSKVALHTCQGKFIKILNEHGKIMYIVCSVCRKSYYSDSVLFFCHCGENYYSITLDEKDDENVMFATWDKYHCPSLSNEKMKCIKCKEFIYYNIKENLLDCKNCKFSIEPNQIIWTCVYCKNTFRSGAKFHNELEFKNLKDEVSKILNAKEIVKPTSIPCDCVKNLENVKFIHKKDCTGELYQGTFGDRTIVVCSVCNSMNYYEHFLFTCPICFIRFKQDYKQKNLDNKFFNIKKKSSISFSYIEEELNHIINKDVINNLKNQINYPTSIENSPSKRNFKFIMNEKECNILSSSMSVSPIDTIKDAKIFYHNKENKERANSHFSKNDCDEEKGSKSINKFNQIGALTYLIDENQSKLTSTDEINNFVDKSNEGEIKENSIILSNNEIKKTNDYMKRKICVSSDILPFIKNEDETNKKSEGTQLSQDKCLKNNKDNNKLLSNSQEIEIVQYSHTPNIIRKKKIDKISNMIRIIDFNKVTDNKSIDEKNENEYIKKKILVCPKPTSSDKREPKLVKINQISQYDIYKDSTPNKNIKGTNLDFSNDIIKNENSINDDAATVKLKVKKIKFIKTSDNSDISTEINKSKRGPEDIRSSDSEEYEKLRIQSIDEEKNMIDDISKAEPEPILTESQNNKIEPKKEPRNIEIETQNIKKETQNNKIESQNFKIESQNIQIEPVSKLNESQIMRIESQNIKIETQPIKLEPKFIKTEIKPSDDYSNIKNQKVYLKNSIMIEKKVPNINVEDFYIIKQIGQGTFGKIYLVQDKYRNKYAMKKIIAHDQIELNKMKKEIELLYNIDHPNVIKILGMCTNKLDITTYGIYFVLELAQYDWDYEIKQRTKIKRYYNENEILNIIKNLVSSLAWLQKNNISHRDIKPQNILIFPGNVYKLTDFGDAKRNKDSIKLNTLRGTELYMSPVLFESLRNEVIDIEHNLFKSDVFSLGYCIIYAASLSYDCLYDIRELWNMDHVIKIIYKHLRVRYSETLIQLICKMIQIDERCRYDFINIDEFIKLNFK